MRPAENVYWPFDVLAPDQRSPTDELKIRFLEAAERGGCRPYRFGSDNYGATHGGRGGEIFYRGRGGLRWEINLAMPGESSRSAHLDDFGAASRALLLWLGGADTSEVFEEIREHLIEGTKPLIVAAPRESQGSA